MDGTPKGNLMVTVKQAVNAAAAAVKEFYSDTEVRGIELEEAELAEDGKFWLITLGFYVPNAEPVAASPNEALVKSMTQFFQPKREYEHKFKVFQISVDSGTVMSMKIRNP
jgi:hypothetical protein